MCIDDSNLGRALHKVYSIIIDSDRIISPLLGFILYCQQPGGVEWVSYAVTTSFF